MFGFYFFALHGHGSNGSEFSLYQPFRHLKVINAHPCTRRPNHFILFIGHVFQHLYHSCCSALGPLQFVNLFTTEQCWPTDRVLLLESPPGQVQRIIPSGALSKWCCIRSPWAPRTLFAAVSQCLSAEYSHCKICFCIWCSGFVTPVLCRDSPGLHYRGKCLISLREWNCEQRWNLAQMKPCLSVPTNRCLPVSRVS